MDLSTLKDLNITSILPTIMFCDNQTTIAIASNPTFHDRTKHIKIDCHFVRDEIVDDFLKVLSICSNLQLTDMFTKALPSNTLMKLLTKLGIFDVHLSTWGGVLESS